MDHKHQNLGFDSKENLVSINVFEDIIINIGERLNDIEWRIKNLENLSVFNEQFLRLIREEMKKNCEKFEI